MDTHTLNERRNPASEPPPPPPEALLGTGVGPDLEPALTPDEERLVALTCTLAGPRSQDLLAQALPSRSPLLVRSAQSFAEGTREARLGTMNRLLAPPPSATAVRNLADRLEQEPPWFVALVCRSVAPQVRDRLLASPRTREAWKMPLAPHPALEALARRFAARCLTS